MQCLPSEALKEYERLPAGLLEDVIEARAYRLTKAACDRAHSIMDRPTGAIADLVTQIEFALAEE